MRRLVVLALVLTLGVSALLNAQSPQPTTGILLLYSHPPEIVAVSAFTHGLRSTIRARLADNVEFYEEYLDLDRYDGERLQQLAQYLAEKYRGFKLDVIVAEGSPALDFAAHHLSGLMPGVAIVYTLATGPESTFSGLPANVVGRRVELPFAATIALARKLQPDAKRLVILSDGSARDSTSVSAALRALAPLRDSIDMQLVRHMPYDRLLATVRALPPQSIVLLAYVRRDFNERSLLSHDLASQLAQASTAPVYAVYREWLGDGIMGGAVVDSHDEGVQTAQLVVQRLNERNLTAAGPQIAPVALAVDWRQLQRWNIPERRVPAGAQVLFRTPTLWDRYGVFLGIAAALIVAQTLLIGLLAVERRRRVRGQIELAEQAEYEQTIAGLTRDTLRHAHEDAPHALEQALARLGQYAGSSAVVLTHYSDSDRLSATQVTWRNPAYTHKPAGEYPAFEGVALEIPLIASGTTIGLLQLYRPQTGNSWSTRMVARLEAGAELIASAVARAEAEQAVRRGEELNRAVLASLAMSIAILDRSGTILRVNEAWREAARSNGVSQDFNAFVGRNYLAECDRAFKRGCVVAMDVRAGVEAVLKHRATAFRYEYHMQEPEQRWYELAVDPLEHVDGGAVVTHLDITDRRLAELHAEQTRNQVAHLGRVAVVGELAAAMSHELRQPLMAIRANAEAGAILLSKNPADIDEATEIFKDIVASDIRAETVIDHMRVLLRKEDPTTTTVDLNDVSRRAVHLLQGDAIHRRVQIELALDTNLPPVVGDPVQLQQLVMNLALNALEAAATKEDDRCVVVGTAASGDNVYVFVRDTGPGLPPDVQQLFEPFYSTKSQGLGMGLAIVRSIVERHGGAVRAEHNENGGATFTVALPNAEGGALLSAPNEQPT